MHRNAPLRRQAGFGCVIALQVGSIAQRPSRGESCVRPQKTGGGDMELTRFRGHRMVYANTCRVKGQDSGPPGPGQPGGRAAQAAGPPSDPGQFS